MQEKQEANTIQSNTGKSRVIELKTPFNQITAKGIREEIAQHEFVSFDSIELVNYKKGFDLKVEDPEIHLLYDNNIIKYQVMDIKEKEQTDIISIYDDSISKEVEENVWKKFPFS